MTEPFAPRCVLVTGGAGFIGVNFVRWLLGHDPAVRVVNLDLLTYAGNLESLEDVLRAHGPGGDGRHYFVQGDIRNPETVQRVLRGEATEMAPGLGARLTPIPDAIVHMAAESHVDRSILGPAVFVATNVQGTLTLLEGVRSELAHAMRPLRFLHVSTDEVYGSLGPNDAPFTESTPLAPNSPYAASKAGSDLLVRAYRETFGLPTIITRCSNNYGPFQFPEKLIPLMITRALEDQPLPVYGDGANVRDWIHVLDHAAAVWIVLTRGRLGEIYNIGGCGEETNIAVVRAILRGIGKSESLIRFVPDRPGHDRRYAMDTTKIRSELGWSPKHPFAVGLAATIRWYTEHSRWWHRVATEAYRAANVLYLPTP